MIVKNKESNYQLVLHASIFTIRLKSQKQKKVSVIHNIRNFLQFLRLSFYVEWTLAAYKMNGKAMNLPLPKSQNFVKVKT